jgi:radical SAM superfamily enzyme YgiQ (UPF0313 family)
VIAELRAVPRDLIFVDDNIARSPDYARELFRQMLPMRKRWVGQCSIEIADDPELLELARAAGCCGLFIGIETVNSENLAAMGKQFNDSAHYRERLRRIRRTGIGIVAGIIVGLDRDEPPGFQDCLRFLQRGTESGDRYDICTAIAPGQE